MRYYIIAGEASGDKHGGKLVEAIHRKDGDATIRAWGGDDMEHAGATIAKHYKDLAFMGFIEVVKNLPTIVKNFKFCKRDIKKFNPDVVILIDYPGFNMRMAKWLHQNGFKVMYYISPQVWAWNESRVHKIDKYVDHLYVILPFEKDFYKKHNIDVTYVGHPLKIQIDDYKERNNVAIDSNLIALLPGSRRQEIELLAPVFIEVATLFPNYTFVIAAAPHIGLETYQKFIPSSIHNVSITEEGTYALLNKAYTCLCTSGTATLETGLFKVPQVVCYIGNSISYQIAKRLISVDFISLVNLIARKEVVKEFIQDECTPENIAIELKKILATSNDESSVRNRMIEGYNELHERLIEDGEPSEIVAIDIIERIMKAKSSK